MGGFLLGRRHDVEPADGSVAEWKLGDGFLALGDVRGFPPLARSVFACFVPSVAPRFISNDTQYNRSRSLPTVYSSATYKTVSASNNGTHWTVETVCSGCSTWSGGSLSTTGTDTFAWAVGRNAVSQPADPGSSFSVHDTIGTFSGALSQGTVPQATFDEHVKNAS